MPQSSVFRDDPIDGIDALDLFDRLEYRDNVVKILSKLRSQEKSSCVLALIGPWGSGKSSFISLLESKIKKDKKWKISTFNPWAYTDLESLTIGFFREINANLPNDKKWKGHSQAFGKLVNTISPIGALTAAYGFDSSAMLEVVGNKLSQTSEVKIKAKIEEGLLELNYSILVVIEDLDRLDPDELLQIFKLVRQVGRLSNIYYLLVYDESTLLDVLKETSLAKNSPIRAIDYLEKLIQIRLDMPLFTENQAQELFNRKLNDILSDHEIPVNDEMNIRFTSFYNPIWKTKAHTPRKIYRYFSQLEVSFPSLRGEIDFIDFMNVTWLRVYYPAVYSLIQERKSDLVGLPRSFAPGANQRAAERDRWEKIILSALSDSQQDYEVVIELLKKMFPALKDLYQPNSGINVKHEILDAQMSIASKQFFDRYFIFGVPSNEYSNQEALRALENLRIDQDSPEAMAFVDFFNQNTDQAVKTIDVLRRNGLVEKDIILDLLTNQYGNIKIGDNLLVNPKVSVQILAARMLFTSEQSEILEYVNKYFSHGENPDLLAAVTRAYMETNISEIEYQPIWFSEYREVVSIILRDYLEIKWEMGEEIFRQECLGLLNTLVLLNPLAAKTWAIEKARKVGVLDFLKMLVPIFYRPDGGEDIVRLGDLEIPYVESYVGVDFALDELRVELDKDESFPAEKYMENSVSNRRFAVLRPLKQERARRLT